MFWYTRCWVFIFYHICCIYILSLLLIFYQLLFVIYHVWFMNIYRLIVDHSLIISFLFKFSPPLLWVLLASSLTFQMKSSRGGGQQLHWKIHEDSGPGKGPIQATPGTRPGPTWKLDVFERCQHLWIHLFRSWNMLEHPSFFCFSFSFWGEVGGIYFWEFWSGKTAIASHLRLAAPFCSS